MSEGLPPCNYRGDPVHSARPSRNSSQPDRVITRYPCVHPYIINDYRKIPRAPPAMMAASICRGCQFVGWSVTAAQSVVPSELRARIPVCDGCEIRQGNYCPQAPGCPLLEKLGREGFQCPMKKF